MEKYGVSEYLFFPYQCRGLWNNKTSSDSASFSIPPSLPLPIQSFFDVHGRVSTYVNTSFHCDRIISKHQHQVLGRHKCTHHFQETNLELVLVSRQDLQKHKQRDQTTHTHPINLKSIWHPGKIDCQISDPWSLRFSPNRQSWILPVAWGWLAFGRPFVTCYASPGHLP